MINSIKIEQALHGYAKGHRLISSSIELPRNLERTLQLLSDMSGPSMIDGFDSYLTAYPLDKQLFAFAKTWYAPEMERPGCVWTHTLILSLENISRIENIKTLLPLFKRPNDNASNKSYYSPICLEDNQLSGDYINNIDDNLRLELAYWALEGLYSHPENPVYLISDNSREYERLVLDLWNQQWPTLKQSFSFCTGSLTSRKINSLPFDLQVIPRTKVRQITKDVPEGIYIDNRNPNKTSVGSFEMSQRALKSALSDLLSGSNTGSIWSGFYRSITGARKEFLRYIEAIEAFKGTQNNAQSIASFTSTLSNIFPGENDALGMKKAIYGERSKEGNDLLNRLDDSLLLKGLLTTKCFESFDGLGLNIPQRALKYWKNNRTECQRFLSELISSTTLNPIGELFIETIAMKLKADDIIDMNNQNVGLIYVFISLNPSLAASKELWNQPNVNSGHILGALGKSKKLSDSKTSEIINAILESNISNITDALVKTFGDLAVQYYLDWVSSFLITNNELKDNWDEWKEILSFQTKPVLDWLKVSEEISSNTLSYLTTILDPNSSDVQNAGTYIWGPLANAKNLNTNGVKVRAFLLALAFNNPDNGASKLVRLSFEEVHNAAEREALDYHSWHIIEQHVPSLSWWNDWDKCERLRRALVDKFIKYNWPIEDFVLSVTNEKTIIKILDYCSKNKQRKKFITEIRNKIVHGELSASRSFSALLNNMST